MFYLLSATRLPHRCALNRPFINNRFIAGTPQSRQLVTSAAMKQFDDIQKLYSDNPLEYTMSLNALGKKLIEGDGMTQDIPHGINVLLLACALNCAAAELKISKLYEQGIGFKQDSQMAELHFNRAKSLAENRMLKE